MLRSPLRLACPAWAQVSPFPSRLLIAPAHPYEGGQLFVLAMMVFTGAFVIFDIAYNITALLAIALFALLGLRVDRANMPLILFLVVFNMGGLIALQPYLDNLESREFMIGTSFVGVTAIFFAMTLNENALARLNAIKWGMILGALIAALAAILGYTKFAGLDAAFTMYEGRASGTFRDPNVLGSFLVLPALFLAHDILTTARRRFLNAALLGPILLGCFLTFSRGSWGAMVIGLGALCALVFLTSGSAAMRARITLAALFGFLALALAFTVILSFEGTAEVFADRFTLQKDYDSGPSGRFGNQLRALPDLLSRPFGHGPNRFSFFYPENPHNTYLMAFSSYGWLGGITFLAFIAATLWVSLRTVFLHTPFQSYAIILCAALIPHLVQNFQIDTDRWRHLFMIYGLSWGLAAIARRWLGEYVGYAHHAYRQAASRPARAVDLPGHLSHAEQA